ncbi:MAG: LuxR C-terminal-related transcriptional regulator [Chloroflexi bacterium]|nr:LuxR C-terminal-related transcriptional regulator [Chloroflexota bacterium]
MELDNQFTEREKEVAKLLLQGKSNKQIALALDISKSTVEFHLKNIYLKLNVNSRTEAVLNLSKSDLRESVGQELKENLWQATGGKTTQSEYSSQAKHFFDPKEEKDMKNRTMIAIVLSAVAIVAVYGMLAYLRSAKLDQNAHTAPLTPNTEQPVLADTPYVVLQVPPEASTRSYNEVLLLLQTSNVPFHYAADFIGIGCFVPNEKNPCAETGPIPFPDGESLSGSSVYWMPDGENGFYVRDNQILVLNHLQRKVAVSGVLVSNILKTDYQAHISPDARWMVESVQVDDPYASDLVLIKTTTGTTSKLDIGLDTCFKTPIGWITPSKFLFRCDISIGATSKKYLTEVHYYTYDVLGNELLEISSGTDIGFGPISPNGKYVIRYEKQNGYYMNYYVKDLSNNQFQSSKLPEGQMVWSHDSSKLAIFTDKGDLIIANYDGSNQEKIFSSGWQGYLSMEWFPDDKYIALIGSSNDYSLASQMIILSTKGDIIKYDPISTTDGYNIVGISPLPVIKK